MDEMELIVAQLKEQFGEIYRADIEDDSYLFRLLTRKEYKDVLALTDDKSLQDEIICQMTVVYPLGLKFSEEIAGLPQALSPIIINESGFGTLKKANMYFDQYRDEMDRSFERQAEAVIQAAFPHVTEEEMEGWNVSKFMTKTAKAEWILKNVMGYDIDFRPEEELQPQEGEPAEPVEPPTAKQMGAELRQEGLDPMMEFAPYILKKKPYAEIPFIGGTSYWRQVFK